MADEATRLIQDVRESLIRMEGKLDNVSEKHLGLEKRVSKLEENNIWLSRTIVGQVIVAIIAFFIFKK